MKIIIRKWSKSTQPNVVEDPYLALKLLAIKCDDSTASAVGG